jgi:predicted ester cyclase
VTEETTTMAKQPAAMPAAIPVDEVDDEKFDSSTAPPMTNVKNPEDPEHRDVPKLEANKGVALRFIEGVFIEQDPNAVDELAADDFVAHTFGDQPPGREPLKEAMKRAGAGVSEAKFEIHDVIAEQDRVAVRLTTRARHTGTFMGLEPSGNDYSIDEIHIFRIQDDKVVEHWHEFDKQRLMQQLQGKGGGQPRGAQQPDAQQQDASKAKGAAPSDQAQAARPTIDARST